MDRPRLHRRTPGNPHRGSVPVRRGASTARLGRDDRTASRAAPGNTLNELSGEEWLYFTKSIWTTAYPSELGHARRKAHGANKPPRLMARLIEFFTRTGELVLDPFAGVGGTLLGAAIAQGPRRALGIELDPRWAAVYARGGRATCCAERDGAGPLPRRPRARAIRAASGRSTRRACELRLGDALRGPADARRRLGRLRGDRPAVQRPAADDDGRRPARRGARQPADRLRDGHATTRPTSPTAPTTATFLDRMSDVLGELRRVLRPGRYAALIVRDAYQDGRYLFTGADLAARAATRRPRAQGRPHLVPGGDAAAAVRLPDGVRAEHRPPAHPRPQAGRSSRAPAAGRSLLRLSPRGTTRGAARCRRSGGPCRPRRSTGRARRRAIRRAWPHRRTRPERRLRRYAA